MISINWLTQWFSPARGEARPGRSATLKAVKQAHRITYSPTLVPELKDDHQELLAIYGEVGALLQDGRYAAIADVLRRFKTKLDVHLLNENLRFYCYLEERLAATPAELEVMQDFRREMNGIARVVVTFLRKYQMSGVNLHNRETFVGEYQQIGAALVERINREEKGLYSLYTA